MERLNKEYKEILSSDEPASTKFWKLEKWINKDKKDTGVVADMRRSQMTSIITDLLNEGASPVDDLSVFSEELQELMKRFYPPRSVEFIRS